MDGIDGGQDLVIVGGGAGGIELAVRLARRRRVTLVDGRVAHLWKPRLHEIAAGLLEPGEEEASYAVQAARHGFRFVLGRMTGLDPAARTIVVDGIPFPRRLKADGSMLSNAATLRYRDAVLALGSTSNPFGTPGVEEHSYALDGPEDAVDLNQALMAEAVRVSTGAVDGVRIVIAGAGTTGIELAAELRHKADRLARDGVLAHADQVAITIVDMADRPLPGLAAETSDYVRRMLDRHRVTLKLREKVASVEADGVVCGDGTRLPAQIVVWATGIRGADAMRGVAGARLDRVGRAEADDRLRVLGPDGAPLAGLYGLGDCVTVPQGDDATVPATAQAAHQQAIYLARVLGRGGEAGPFRYRYRGTLVSLGSTSAVGDVPTPGRGRSLSVRGLGARLAYSWLYRSHQAELSGWRDVAAKTAAATIRGTTSPAAKLHW